MTQSRPSAPGPAGPGADHFPGLDEATISVIHSRRIVHSSIAELLEKAGYQVSRVALGPQLTDTLSAEQPDVLAVDHTTTDFDLVRLCRELRRSFAAPILVYASGERVGDDSWVVDVLDAGATDVVAVETSRVVTLARFRAALRITPRSNRTPDRLVVGDVVIDLDAHLVVIDGEPVSCPPILFSLLTHLARSVDHVVTFQALLVQVWGVAPTADTRRVRVATSLLRRLLGEGPRRPRIETVSRIGYRLALA